MEPTPFEIDWKLLISIAALVLSLLSWIRIALSERKNLKIHIKSFSSFAKGVDYGDGIKHDTFLNVFYVIIENKSRLSISITGVSLLYKEGIYPCKYSPVFVKSVANRQGSHVLSYREKYSLEFPVNIASLAGVNGYLLFESPQQLLPVDAKQATFQVSTTRGALEVSLSLPETE